MRLNELQRLLTQNAAFTPPSRILAALPPETRTARPPGVTHSIAEELWHVVFWQNLFLRWAQRELVAYPEHAAEGWRRLETVEAADWREMVARFEAGLAEVATIAGRPDLSERYSSMEEPGAGTGPLTLLELLMNVAVHNAYHLGRIVQLRQMLGLWPPPGGGDTW
jgi:uncharacterized damage-inducible protein DinB